MEIAVCIDCLLEKELHEFPINKTKRNGRSSLCKPCNVKRAICSREARKKADPDAFREADRVRNINRHGLSIEQFQYMKINQNYRCIICKEIAQLHVDHDHNCCPGIFSCGKCVRGLLCQKCNQALGLLREDPKIMKSMISYIVGL